MPVVCVGVATVASVFPLYWASWWGALFFFFAAGTGVLTANMLPHEKRFFRKVQRHLDRMEYETVITLLDSRREWLMTPAAICKNLIFRVKKCLQSNDWLGAYHNLNRLAKHAMLPDEKELYLELFACLYYNMQNHRDLLAMEELLRDEFGFANDPDRCLLLKSFCREVKGEIAGAKAVIERALNHTTDPAERISLYNNLARLEKLSGNKQEQLSHLTNAYTILKSNYFPHLFPIVYHNLLILYAKTGEKSEAIRVLAEYESAIDKNNLQQYLGYTNDALHMARELGDQAIIDKVHTLDKGLISLASEQERFTIRVHELRMVRNGNQSFPDYMAVIKDLLSGLEILPAEEQVLALVEIIHDIENELKDALAKNAQLGDNKRLSDLHYLHQSACRQLVAKHHIVDQKLLEIPPALFFMRQEWLKKRHSILKTSISLAEKPSKQSFVQLFDQLEERVRLCHDKSSVHEEVSALIVICDEFVAYRDNIGGEFHRDFIGVALNAYRRADQITRGQVNSPRFCDLMLGLAYFAWKLGNDKNLATFWLRQADRHIHSMLHYAVWLRRQRQEILEWLNN